MEYARLESALLRDVDDTYYFSAQCRQCGHGARLSLTRLRDHLGDGYPLVKVREKLRCERCGNRNVVITFLAPDQRTGNLVHLFDRSPRR
jgi:ribosomal protein S14